MAIASVLAAMTLVVLDAGMVNVALPTMAAALTVSPADAVLVITAYQTALVMALLPCAALGRRLGNHRVFRAGVAVFLVGSVLCALSPSLPWLLGARLLQGLGGAAVMALGVALLRVSVPPGRLGAAVGWNALAVALSAAAAPTLGALIIANLAWPCLFLAGLPVGTAALLAARRLPPVAGGSERLDLLSMALSAASFALLVLAAQALPKSPLAAVWLLASAAAAFAALVRREAPKTAPLFPLDLLARRPFRFSVIASVCCFTGQSAGMIALPFYLQHGFGQSPLMVGFYITPWPLGVAAMAAVAGRLSDSVPTAWLCAAGGGCLALGLAATALWPLAGAPYPVLALMAICGAGFGLFQVSNNRNMFLAAPPDRSGAAGGLQGTARLTGQVSGAVITTLLFTVAAPADASRMGLAAGAAFALAAALVSAMRSPSRETTTNAAI